MPAKIHGAGMAVAAALLIVLGSGCASSPVTPPSSSVPSAAVPVENAPMTDYMRSRVGTPEELSPLAPAEARNVRKHGNRWICDLHGQTMVFNDAASRWEPRQK
jgi:hypothetical protein